MDVKWTAIKWLLLVKQGRKKKREEGRKDRGQEAGEKKGRIKKHNPIPGLK